MVRIFSLLSLISFSFLTLGQTPPPGSDPTWGIQKQDDFNSFNSTDWISGYPWDQHYNGYDDVYYDSGNLIYSNGVLKIKSEDIHSSPIYYQNRLFYYKGGTIWSNFFYKYGYFEIEAKLPVGRGFWPAFWVWYGGGTNCSDWWYNEIDIVELSGIESALGRTNNHYHWWDNVNCKRDADQNQSLGMSSSITNYHKYAVMWEPNKMTFYYDDVIVRTVTNHVPDHALNTILDLSIDTRPFNFPSGTTFPSYMEINYLKIWQLNMACSTADVFCSTAFNKSTYNYAIKQSITIGGNGCT